MLIRNFFQLVSVLAFIMQKLATRSIMTIAFLMKLLTLYCLIPIWYKHSASEFFDTMSERTFFTVTTNKAKRVDFTELYRS